MSYGDPPWKAAAERERIHLLDMQRRQVMRAMSAPIATLRPGLLGCDFPSSYAEKFERQAKEQGDRRAQLLLIEDEEIGSEV